VDSDSNRLVRELRDAGLSEQVVKAAWPSWWSDDLASSPSGRAELRFALARKLGLSPRGLIGERVEFVWNDQARFKHLSTESVTQRAALASFGVTIGRLLVRATPSDGSLEGLDAHQIREAVLASRQYVDLPGLLAVCWGAGIPVIYLRVFPLTAKSMHAMVVEAGERYAILLARDARYPAPVAFTLAHELGHALLGHLADASALVDLEDPAMSRGTDEQESEADRFALTLLTGRADPEITTSVPRFNAPTLANAVLNAGREHRIEPGTLALCLAYRRGAWPVAMASLKFIYGRALPVWREVNAYAGSQLDWGGIGDESADYIRNVMDADG